MKELVILRLNVLPKRITIKKTKKKKHKGTKERFIKRKVNL